ncbi:MAG: FliM/FliN family flagellar motor switch protein [Candidatus Hydrogenedentota bacterium]
MSTPEPEEERVQSGAEYQEELAPQPTPSEHLSLEDLHAVKLKLTADLGQTTLLVREVLELKRGSVLPLEKVAGEMADIELNGIPFAKGEIVVLGDTLHVRISDIINPKGTYSS